MPVRNNPFESIYQYPIEGNGFKVNAEGTHVFWPARQKIFSKFYINMVYEKQQLFGISEQNFIGLLKLNKQCELLVQSICNPFSDSGNALAIVGATIGANDHLAFVKVVGPWNDGTSDRMENSNGNSDMDHMPLEYRLQILKRKIDLYFKWYHVANTSAVLHKQTVNPAQILFSNAIYNSEDEHLLTKLLAEMDMFSSGLSHKDYQQFDKSALMCIHINPGGRQLSKEEDGRTGWWLPLKHNLIAYRAMGYQKPLTTLRMTLGQISMMIASGVLIVVFKGTQMWRTDIDGLYFNNMHLGIAPPNNIPDLRPPPPALPMEPDATAIQEAFNALPNDYNLPWLPRNQLCSDIDLQSRFSQLSEACGYPFNPTENCQIEVANFYPCLNFLLRPSKRHNHGMDSFIDFIIVLHIFGESPPFFWKALAIDKPWDEEFAHAINILGLDMK